jgi:hypothetical protein
VCFGDDAPEVADGYVVLVMANVEFWPDALAETAAVRFILDLLSSWAPPG